ncbi:MAG: ABC transporter substrate-binding protein [Actinomycetes bacterium]|jgi:ribose transport system substrate-binding protein
MKKVLNIIAAAAAMVLIVGTGSPVNAADKTLKIELISKGETHQFWQAVKKGAEQQAAKMNATIHFQGPANETMIDKQLEMLDAAIALKPDAIGYAALGTTQSVTHLKAANKAGIPVYMFDTAASCPGALGTASDCALGVAYTDSKAAGKLAADKMAALVGSAGKVLVVGHSQTNQTGIDRRDGFINQMNSKYKGIKLLTTQYAEGGDALKAQEIVSAALVANPDLKGIYATNEGISIGAGQAFKAAKLANGKVKLIGFDSGKQQIANIKSGLQSGAITQNPIGIGAKTVEALVNYVRNKTVPKTLIDTGFYYYDKKNIAAPEIVADLYE